MHEKTDCPVKTDMLPNYTQNWLPSENCAVIGQKCGVGVANLLKPICCLFFLSKGDLVLRGCPSSVPWVFCRSLGRCSVQVPPGGGARHQNRLTWRTSSGHPGSCPSGKGGTSFMVTQGPHHCWPSTLPPFWYFYLLEMRMKHLTINN